MTALASTPLERSSPDTGYERVPSCASGVDGGTVNLVRCQPARSTYEPATPVAGPSLPHHRGAS